MTAVSCSKELDVGDWPLFMPSCRRFCLLFNPSKTIDLEARLCVRGESIPLSPATLWVSVPSRWLCSCCTSGASTACATHGKLNLLFEMLSRFLILCTAAPAGCVHFSDTVKVSKPFSFSSGFPGIAVTKHIPSAGAGAWIHCFINKTCDLDHIIAVQPRI